MTVSLVLNPHNIKAGDLLLMERDPALPVLPGWTRIPDSPYWFSRAVAGGTIFPLPGAALSGIPDDDQGVGRIPEPNEHPRHDLDDPCTHCDELRLWWAAWEAEEWGPE